MINQDLSLFMIPIIKKVIVEYDWGMMHIAYIKKWVAHYGPSLIHLQKSFTILILSTLSYS